MVAVLLIYNSVLALNTYNSPLLMKEGADFMQGWNPCPF